RGSQSHVGRHPIVRGGLAFSQSWSFWPLPTWRAWKSYFAPPSRLRRPSGSAGRSTTRSHGAPHAGQQPFALVPARMHRSASSGGNVAKWAPEYGLVVIVQTERALRCCGSTPKRLVVAPVFRSAPPSPLVPGSRCASLAVVV